MTDLPNESLEATLESAWDAAEAVEPDEAPATPSLADTLEEAWDESGVEDVVGSSAPRGPDGRFVSVAPPEHWSDEDKTRFTSLPANARQTVLDWRKQIETGANEKFEAAAEARKFYEEVGQYLAPLDPLLQQSGLSRAQAIQRLIAAEQALRTNPGAAFQQLLAQYGPDYELVRRGAEPVPPGQVDPNAIAAVVEQRIQASLYQQQAEAAAQAATVSIREFAEAKDANGQPAYPHFDAVKVQMGALMQSGAADTLEAAYQQAVWTKPELREALTKAQAEQQAKEAAAARKAGVAKARQAATPRSASVPAMPEDISKMSLGAMLERSWADAGLDAH